LQLNIKTALLIALCWPFFLFSQDTIKYPQEYFRSPLDIPLFLAGNFGEIRNNHFHAGLDIKTEGVEGKKIYCTADGYVSRIKISHGGYGKCLYVTHPNGYTTVYAHLQKFNDDIEKYVHKHQYKKESYTMELFPGRKTLLLKKGEIIAISGNSGGSGGPHLHFEVRKTKSEVPVNPLLFGFKIKDNIRPKIKALGIYPLDDSSHVNGKNKPKIYKVSGGKGNYSLAAKSPISVYGKIGFGLYADDYFSGSNNRCGVYFIKLLVDSQQIYSHEMEKIGFHETRYINSHVDYHNWHKNGLELQRCYIQPNNRLNIYNDLKNNGLYYFNDTLIHQINYLVKDVSENTSTLKFNVQASPEISIEKDTTQFTLLKHDEYNSFKTNDIIVGMPANILYHDLKFEYSLGDTIKGAIAPLHNIHNLYEPLHSYMTVSIKTGGLKNGVKEKALIVSLTKDNQLFAEGGTWEAEDNSAGFITVKTRSFGSYTVVLDTVPPKITPINILPNRNMAEKEKIIMKITDNLAGIASYRGTIDGKWILMEYDYKADKLTYFFDDELMKKGKHRFKLVVTDKRGNTHSWQANFTR